MSASLFLLFDLSAMASCFFFASRTCFKNFSRFQDLLDLSQKCSLKSRKVLENNYEKQKSMKPWWKVKKLRKADVMEIKRYKLRVHGKMSKMSDADMYMPFWCT